jgi:group I intron endonuclease
MVSGIYIIEDLKTRKVYVGSSQDIKTRVRYHFRMLENGIHHNSKLQRKYNRHTDFMVSGIIECCDLDNLLIREKFWIDFYSKQKRALNQVKDPTRGIRGYRFSPEQRKRVSEGHKGQTAWNKGIFGSNGQKRTDIQKKRISDSLTGKQREYTLNRVYVGVSILNPEDIVYIHHEVSKRYFGEWDYVGIFRCLKGDRKTYKKRIWHVRS